MSEGKHQKSVYSRGVLYTLLKVCPGIGLSSQAVSSQLLSLLARFTSVFEMGTGGTTPPWHQDVYPDNCINILQTTNLCYLLLTFIRSKPLLIIACALKGFA